MSLYKDKFKRAKKAVNIGEYRKFNRMYEDIKLINEEYTNIFQTLIDSIPSPIFFKDNNGVYKACNDAFADFLGYSKREIIGHTSYDVSPKEFADVYHKADLELMNNKVRQIYETQVKHSDGSSHEVIFAKNTLINSEGKAYGLVGVMFDITDRKKAEKRANRLLRVKEAMLEISHVVLRIDNTNELFSLILEKAIECMENAEMGSVLLVDKKEYLKVAAFKGYEEEKAKRFCIRLKDSFVWKKSSGNIKNSVIINDVDKIENQVYFEILKDKERYKTKSVIAAPIIIEGSLYGIISIDSSKTNVFDDTDLEIMDYLKNQVEISITKHKLYEEIIYLSRHDKLTGLYNRCYFEEMIEKIIEKAIRDNGKFSLIMFDLDGLKKINDNYGHLAGDIYIKTISSSLVKSIRNNDVIGRVGGDEFVAICMEGNEETLNKRFSGLLKENTMDFEGNKITCSFSYGIASFPKDGTNIRDIAKTADARMYDHKKSKKAIVGKFANTNKRKGSPGAGIDLADENLVLGPEIE